MLKMNRSYTVEGCDLYIKILRIRYGESYVKIKGRLYNKATEELYECKNYKIPLHRVKWWKEYHRN